ncbi:hypothetical protein GCM10007053_16340 [Halioglobus pacificus]|uniref:Uncharacterized protein n=1 Tax=Parahalioglobus pacificus TaxID=930806 RepID=A0A918XI40_9GAMM|nr:hypothetical protein GCM10007053_16340 [Halioglobus pacificus]
MHTRARGLTDDEELRGVGGAQHGVCAQWQVGLTQRTTPGGGQCISQCNAVYSWHGEPVQVGYYSYYVIAGKGGDCYHRARQNPPLFNRFSSMETL